MKARPGTAATLHDILDPPAATDDDERRMGRLLDVIRSQAAHQTPIPAVGSRAAARMAFVAAGRVETRLAPLLCVEVVSAALAAPWLADDAERARASWTALVIAGRLTPEAQDPLRDTGTWGLVAAAVAIDRARGGSGAFVVAELAASLALERLSASDHGTGYLAARVAHSASTALTAIRLADAGFTSDAQSLETLCQRLDLAPCPWKATADGRRVVSEAIEYFDRAPR